MTEKTKVSILGASGFTGRELIKIFLKHPMVEIDALFSRAYAGKDISDIFPSLKGSISCELIYPTLENIPQSSEVIFLALPHTKSIDYIPHLIEKKRLVVDLSADYRFSSPEDYKKWYGVEHTDPDNLLKSVYGIPEINRDQIKDARLISNPGCYSTCAILSIYPLLKEGIIKSPIFIDAKSGISGAGKKLDDEYLFSKRYENITPYKVNAHRHMGEITEFLNKVTAQKFNLIFCPHLIPIERGILSNLYCQLSGNLTEEDIRNLYLKHYKDEHFINVAQQGEFPQPKEVNSTNNFNVGIKFDSYTNSLIVIAAIDNLIKGASGQAVQNMNIALGFEESAGLK